MLQRSSDVKKPASLFPRSSLRQPSPLDRQIRRGNSLGGTTLPTTVKFTASTSGKPTLGVAGSTPAVEQRVHSSNSLLSSNSNSSTEASADALANMLLALTQLDPSRAYNSAYARVGATLLGVFGAGDEERAFWTLAAMLKDRLFPHTRGEVMRHVGLHDNLPLLLLSGQVVRVEGLVQMLKAFRLVGVSSSSTCVKNSLVSTLNNIGPLFGDHCVQV